MEVLFKISVKPVLRRESQAFTLKNHKSLLNSLARVPLNTLPSFSFDRISVLLSLCALPLGIYSRPVSGLSPFLLSTISSNFKNTSNRGCANHPNFIPRKKVKLSNFEKKLLPWIIFHA